MSVGDVGPVAEFGPYRLLAELGRGGQGTVWLAEDTKLKRNVALKVLSTAAGALSDDQVARFRREAEATSKLDHPNICGLLDAGEVAGTPYLAYRFVEGHTLAERIAQSYARREGVATDCDVSGFPDASSRAGIEKVTALVEKLARALHVAHEKGLVHRDVKPGNVMITPDGEPVLLDFGLARDELGDDLTLTHSGDLLGTPAYMSPEQLTAHRVPLDRRTDVYSLGATLYEALTLQKPFTGRTRAELYQRILAADPSSVSALNRQIPHDLRVVVETAIDKDRNRRYQTALAFAEDLRRFRQFEPVNARPIGRALRLRRWAQRQPVVATIVTAVLLLLTTGLGISLHFLDQVKAEQRATLAAARRSRASALANASAVAAGEDQLLALALAREGVRLQQNPETLSRLYAAASSAYERRRLVHPGLVAWVEASRDHDLLLTACADGVARVWRWEDGDVVENYRHEDAPPLAQATFSSDDAWIATAHGRQVDIWKRGESAPTAILEGPEADVTSVRFSPDDQWILIGRTDGRVELWNLQTRRTRWTVDAHRLRINSAEFSTDGQRITTASYDGRVRIFDLDGELLHELRTPDPPDTVNHARFSLDGRTVLVSLADRTARLWNIESGLLEVTFGGHEGSAYFATRSADQQWILTTSSDQSARLFDASGALCAVFRGHRNSVPNGAFLGPSTVATASFDGTVRIWDFAVPRMPILRGHRQLLRSARFDDTGTRLVTTSRDGYARVWSESGHLLRELPQERAEDARFLGDGTRVMTLSANGQVRIHSLMPDHAVVELRPALGSRESLDPEGFGTPQRAADVSPGGSRIALCVHHTLVIASLTNGKTIRVLQHPSFVWDASWSSDGARVITACGDGHAYLWDVDAPTDAPLKSYVGHDGEVRSVCLAPGGDRVLTSSNDRTARVWSLEGREIARLDGHTGPVLWARWSPRGDRILTVSRDRTARLWDAETYELVAILRGHEGQIWRGAFSPSGDRVVTASWDRTARIWPVDPADLMKIANERLKDVVFTVDELGPYRDILDDAFERLTEVHRDD